MAQQWKKNYKNSKGYTSRDFVRCAQLDWKSSSETLGRTPLLLFTLLPFLPAPPPSLHHFLSASQRTSDAGVCERAQSMKHNPSTKVFQSGCETFFFCRDKPDNRTRRWKWTIKTAREVTRKISECLKSCGHLHTSKRGWGGLNGSPSLLSCEPRLSVTQTTSYTWLASGHMNTDAIKPTLCLANTSWQAFSQSSVCDIATGERSYELRTLQSSVC